MVLAESLGTVSDAYSIATMAVSEILSTERKIMPWPWNLGQGSFKIIGNGTIQ